MADRKEAIAELQGIKEQMEQTEVQMEQAQRRNDLAEASRLGYGVIRNWKSAGQKQWNVCSSCRQRGRC